MLRIEYLYVVSDFLDSPPNKLLDKEADLWLDDLFATFKPIDIDSDSTIEIKNISFGRDGKFPTYFVYNVRKEDISIKIVKRFKLFFKKHNHKPRKKLKCFYKNLG